MGKRKRDVSAAEKARRLTKFLRRCNEALSGPIFELGDRAFEVALVMTRDADGNEGVDLQFAEVGFRDLKVSIADCRVFFMSSEGSYLPGIVEDLRDISEPEHSQALQPLADRVAGCVLNGRLVGTFSYAGRLEMDNGLGPGQLLGSDQIAMDYIYGVALHEDDDRIARLENIPNSDSIRHTVTTQLAFLMSVVQNVRDQIHVSQLNGRLSETVDLGTDT
ncbi:hypothetical protein [Plantibacter sp. LMC-P-059a]|uniref:hypothetical protein n=1 Tax=Plantibacter sp. LMC-P-059a TaxID=3040297 RepID=UPI00254E9159|nr:hypothetical protein [Plantibacter sp. LMC-P-059a]